MQFYRLLFHVTVCCTDYTLPARLYSRSLIRFPSSGTRRGKKCVCTGTHKYSLRIKKVFFIGVKGAKKGEMEFGICGIWRPTHPQTTTSTNTMSVFTYDYTTPVRLCSP